MREWKQSLKQRGSFSLQKVFFLNTCQDEHVRNDLVMLKRNMYSFISKETRVLYKCNVPETMQSTNSTSNKKKIKK